MTVDKALLCNGRPERGAGLWPDGPCFWWDIPYEDFLTRKTVPSQRKWGVEEGCAVKNCSCSCTWDN